MTLDILISTFEGGIARVEHVLLPPQEGIRYVVAWQWTAPTWANHVPTWASRPDVTLLSWHGRGLSANRNHALAAARGDAALICDDDCRLVPEALHQVLRLVEEHPEVDVFLLRMADYNGRLLKAYPTAPFDYAHRPRGYYPSSCEMLLRTGRPLPCFDTRFGLGSDRLACGEEEVFLLETLRRGLRVEFFPLTVVSTLPLTTGARFATDAGVRRAKGAVLCLQHGTLGAVLRCLKFAWLHPPFLRHFADMLQGIQIVRKG